MAKLCPKSVVIVVPQDTDSDENSDEAPGPWPLKLEKWMAF